MTEEKYFFDNVSVKGLEARYLGLNHDGRKDARHKVAHLGPETDQGLISGQSRQ